jgi:D-threo-aldose 1-dehydrogenase
MRQSAITPVPPAALPTRRLGRTALSLSVLGLGSTGIGGMFAATEEADALAAVTQALDAGIRYLDTAPLYGHGLAEHRIGSALRMSASVQPVLSTKVGWLLQAAGAGQAPDAVFHDGGAFTRTMDLSYDGTMRSVEDSLQRLRVARVDMLFIHDVDRRNLGEAFDERFAQAMSGAYRALLSLREQGVVQAIGAGLNDWASCHAFAEAGDFDAFLLAGRFTLLDQGALASFLPLCQRRQIGVVLGGPFNSGVLAGAGVSAAKFDYADAPPAVLQRAQVLRAACTDFGVDLRCAALQFPLLHPAITSVVAGMRSAAEVLSNVAAMHTPIPPALWAHLREAGLIDAALVLPGDGA